MPNPSLNPTRYGRPSCPYGAPRSSCTARASRPASAGGLAQTLGVRTHSLLHLLVTLDYNVIATGLITGLAAPVAVLLVKTLLDFSLAHYFVKYLWWLPVRGLFRDNPIDLTGKWEQVWGSGGSQTYQDPTDRHSYTTIRQFGRYVYAEFDAKGDTYAFFGKIRGAYLIAEWYDIKDKYAYFGAAQFRIVDRKNMEGLYVGHSRRTAAVGQDAWHWRKH